DEGEQHVLQHVDAVEVVVADGIDWGLQRDPQREQTGQEIKGVLATRVGSAAGQPRMNEKQQDEPRVDGDVKRPRNHSCAVFVAGREARAMRTMATTRT